MDRRGKVDNMKAIPGFKYREDSGADIRNFSEALNGWKFLTFPGAARTLDLGAHIGVFAYMAAPKSRKILCIEPSIESYELLVQNVELIKTLYPKLKIETLRVAAVQNDLDRKMVQIYQKKNSETSDTLIPTRGRIGSPALGVSITSLCKIFKPTTVKCDIEGSEYSILPEILSFKTILEIGVEFHRIQQPDYLRQAKAIHETIISNWGGSNVLVKTPVFDKKYWHTIAVYRRSNE